jgi:hypothetical protein
MCIRHLAPGDHQIPHDSGIGQQSPALALHGRGDRVRPGELLFGQPGVALPGLFHGIEVLGQQGPAPAACPDSRA